MQEEYGVKLKILTESLQTSVNKAKGIVSKFVTQIKTDFEEARKPIDLNINNEKFSSQIRYIEDRIDRLKAKLENKDIKLEDMLKTEADIEKLTNQLNILKDKEKQVGEEAEDAGHKMSGISVNAKMTNNTIVNGFKDSWKSIKRFAFSLLSLRGIYGLVRRASSAYMAQDTGLAKQMQRTWASVGAMMAPIIQTLVKWIRIGAAYLNYFIKALTGKDLIGKAVKKINAYNKSLGGTAKSAKALNKELTSLDEVTNLSFDDASTSGIEDAAEAFDDFGDIKLDKKITDILDTVAEKLKEVKKFLQPIIDWAVKNPGAVIAILGGVKLISLLSKLVGGGGLLGTLGATLLGIGAAAVSLYVIYDSIKKIKDANDELNKALDNTYEIHKGNKEMVKETIDQAQEQIEKTKKRTDATDKYNQTLLNGNNRITAQIKATRGAYNNWTKLTGQYKKTDKTIKEITEKEKNNTKALYDNYKMGILSKNQTKQFKKYLEQQIKDYEELASKTKKGTTENKLYNDRLRDLKSTLSDISGKKYEAHVDIDNSGFSIKTKGIQDVLDKFKNTTYKTKVEIDAQKEKEVKDKATQLGNDLKNKVAKTFQSVLNLKVGTKDAKNQVKNFVNKSRSAISFAGIMNKINQSTLNALLNAIPAYDVGTSYVPNDQLAMIHKGEAIIPKKFNNQQYFNSNNEETNMLLLDLNKNVIELRNRPNIIEIDGKKFAQLTYKDYQNEGNRLNQSTGIKESD